MTIKQRFALAHMRLDDFARAHPEQAGAIGLAKMELSEIEKLLISALREKEKRECHQKHNELR